MIKAAMFRSSTSPKGKIGVTGNMLLVMLTASLACLASCVTTQPMPPVAATAPATEPFLSPGDFAEGYAPQPEPVVNGLQSTYSGTVAVTMMDRTAVARVLPPGFHLAVPITPSARHPVIHLIGDQLEPSTLTWGVPIQVGSGYREMVLLVPYVVRNSGSGLYNFAARMFLSDPTAVAGGNEIFGYAKMLAWLDKVETATRTNYKITTLDSSTTWYLDEIDLMGPWSQTPASLPRWTDLREIFRMPVLGLRPADDLRPAQFICSYWEWDFADAELAAATSRHQFVTKFLDGTEDWVTAGPLSSAPDGAVAVRRVRWRLAIPPAGC